MKLLICGDLHVKMPVLREIRQFDSHYDKIIFTGDYVDDWNAYPTQNMEFLEYLIMLKRNDPDTYVLLLGNHDLSEWQGGKFKCSGYNESTSMLAYNLYERNEDDFSIAYAFDNFLVTHAGVTNGWLQDTRRLKMAGIGNVSTAEGYARVLNRLYINRHKSPEHEKAFQSFTACGPARGGWKAPSPIWADKSELITDPIPKINQIVGHTPVNTITEATVNGASLHFCDTHSTYSTGEPIGDNTALEYDTETKEFKVIKLFPQYETLDQS